MNVLIFYKFVHVIQSLRLTTCESKIDEPKTKSFQEYSAARVSERDDTECGKTKASNKKMKNIHLFYMQSKVPEELLGFGKLQSGREMRNASLLCIL